MNIIIIELYAPLRDDLTDILKYEGHTVIQLRENGNIDCNAFEDCPDVIICSYDETETLALHAKLQALFQHCYGRSAATLFLTNNNAITPYYYYSENALSIRRPFSINQLKAALQTLEEYSDYD